MPAQNGNWVQGSNGSWYYVDSSGTPLYMVSGQQTGSKTFSGGLDLFTNPNIPSGQTQTAVNWDSLPAEIQNYLSLQGVNLNSGPGGGVVPVTQDQLNQAANWFGYPSVPSSWQTSQIAVPGSAAPAPTNDIFSNAPVGSPMYGQTIGNGINVFQAPSASGGFGGALGIGGSFGSFVDTAGSFANDPMVQAMLPAIVGGVIAGGNAPIASEGAAGGVSGGTGLTLPPANFPAAGGLPPDMSGIPTSGIGGGISFAPGAVAGFDLGSGLSNIVPGAAASLTPPPTPASGLPDLTATFNPGGNFPTDLNSVTPGIAPITPQPSVITNPAINLGSTTGADIGGGLLDSSGGLGGGITGGTVGSDLGGLGSGMTGGTPAMLGGGSSLAGSGVGGSNLVTGTGGALGAGGVLGAGVAAGGTSDLLGNLGNAAINAGTSGLDLSAREAPGLAALAYAASQPGLDLGNLNNILSGLGGNQNAIIRAATDPFQQNIAAGYGDLLQSQGLRGIRGSSFGDTDIANYMATTGRALSNAGANAAQGSLALQGQLAGNVATLQNQAQQIKNNLYGRAFDVLGRGLNPANYGTSALA